MLWLRSQFVLPLYTSIVWLRFVNLLLNSWLIDWLIVVLSLFSLLCLLFILVTWVSGTSQIQVVDVRHHRNVGLSCALWLKFAVCKSHQHRCHNSTIFHFRLHRNRSAARLCPHRLQEELVAYSAPYSPPALVGSKEKWKWKRMKDRGGTRVQRREGRTIYTPNFRHVAVPLITK